MADFKAKIEAARSEGYSDDEIVNFLSEGELSGKIKAARDEGYSASHVGGQTSPAAPPATPATEASPDAPVAPKKPWHSFLTEPLQYGADQAVNNTGAGLEALGKSIGDPAISKMGTQLAGVVDAPKDYGTSYSETFGNAGGEGYNWSSLPGAMLEQVPQYAGSLATRVAGAGVGAAVAGPAGAVAGGLAGPAAFEFVQQVGPNALAVAKNNGRDVPTFEDWTQAAATAGVSGAMNAVGVAKIPGLNKLLGTAVKEGATETAQSFAQQIGTSVGTKAGLEIDPKAALAEGIIGGTAAGGMNIPAATGRGLAAVNRAAKAPYEVADANAATRVADRLKYVSETMGYDLTDPSTNRYTSEAFNEILGSAHSSLAEEIKATFNQLKPELNSLGDGTVDGLITRATANAGIRDAKNKRKGIVTPKQYDTIASAIGHTDVGQKALSLLKESNELTRLANRDVMGGLSGRIEYLNPTSGSNFEKAIKVATLSGAGFATGGLTLAAPVAYGAARAIDKYTGRRHTVNKFIKDYDGKPINPIQGESLSGIRQRQAADIMAERVARTEAKKAQREAAVNAQREQRIADRAAKAPQTMSNTTTKSDMYPDSEIIMRAMWEDPSVVSEGWLKQYGSELSKVDYRSAAIIKNRNEAKAAKAALKAQGQKVDKEVIKSKMQLDQDNPDQPVSDKDAIAEIDRQASAVMKVARMRQKTLAEAAPRKVPAAQALGGDVPVNSNEQVELPPPTAQVERVQPDHPVAYERGFSKNVSIDNAILAASKKFKGTELGSALEWVYKRTVHDTQNNGVVIKRKAGNNAKMRYNLIKEAGASIIDEQQFAEFMDMTSAYRERYPYDEQSELYVNDPDVPF